MQYFSLGISISSILTVAIVMLKIVNGFKCLLRSKMLDTYYKCKENRQIHEYEYQSFVYCYEAYKSMKGNSFIEKIYKEIQEYEVIR